MCAGGTLEKFVPDCRVLEYKRTLAGRLCIGRRDLKQPSVRGGAKLSGRNINLENVVKVLRTVPSERGKKKKKKNRWRRVCS